MLGETFTERLKRTIYVVSFKDKDAWFSIAFTSEKEANKFRKMYPNKSIFLNASYLYDKAEDAIKIQKLNLVIKDDK